MMIDLRTQGLRNLAIELLTIQQGSKDDAIALLQDCPYPLTEEEMEQVVIFIEDLVKLDARD